MASIQLGGGVTGISGSIGGTTFSRNRFGAYARPRTIPVNPNSPRQVAAKARLAFLSEQWHETPMTDATRAAWDAYASGISATGAFGQPITLTGFNTFIAGNSVKLLNGADFVEAGPTEIGLPAQDPLFSATLSVASGIAITFDDTFEWADEDDAFLSVSIGKPQNASRNFFGGPYRFELGVAGSSTVPPTSPTAAVAITGWTLVLGQKLWVRARILKADGRVTDDFGAMPVVVGA